MHRLMASLLATALFVGASICNANAADYPTRPIRIINPWTTGGAGDAMARVVAEKLQSLLNQQVVVESRPGGATLVATDHVAKSPPDGYTILLISSSITVNPVALPGAKYDPIKDFTTIGQIATAPHLLVVSPSINVKTLSELVDLAKKKPGVLNYASTGVGSSTHLQPEILKQLTGADIVHVPYQGIAAAIVDAMGGRVHLLFGTVASLNSHVQSKALTALAITGQRRVQAAKDVPTFAEAGLKEFDVVDWLALFTPSGVDPAIVQKLDDALKTALQDEQFRDKLQKIGFEPSTLSREEFAKSLINDPWARVARDLKIRIDP